jgi:hypothetical protein
MKREARQVVALFAAIVKLTASLFSAVVISKCELRAMMYENGSQFTN